MDQRAFLGAPSDPFVQALAAMLMQVLKYAVMQYASPWRAA